MNKGTSPILTTAPVIIAVAETLEAPCDTKIFADATLKTPIAQQTVNRRPYPIAMLILASSAPI